jgi:mannose-6-phosphate isomerase-like protein (cupin superfamily)
MNELKELIIKSQKERKPFVIKKFYSDTSGWSYYIDVLNKMMKDDQSFNFKTGSYYFGMNFPEHALHHVYPHFDEFYNIIHSAHPSGVIINPVILISLFDNIDNLTEHADPADQLHLAAIGSSTWKVKLDDGTIEEYILNPGDFIFVPTLLPHKVDSLTPRVALTYTANNRVDVL